MTSLEPNEQAEAEAQNVLGAIYPGFQEPLQSRTPG